MLIEKYRAQWGDTICETLINKKISIGMNQRMVAYSWGTPNEIDQRSISKTGIDRERWVYGIPCKGAQYIYFKNGFVDKMQGG
jgi:hypothetical protein